jgi:hypothetical protein
MKLLIMFISWFILLVACWPIALLVLVLFPLLWLVALPFRLVAVVVEASFALIRALLFLPARLLGGRRSSIRTI